MIAGLAGAGIGLLLAQLISLRLRRLAAAAEAVRAGQFDVPLAHGFPDEFGSVTAAFERMQTELARSFGRLAFERDRLRLLLERLEEGVVTVDRQLTVRFANGEARRILGENAPEGEPLPDDDALQLRALVARLFDGRAGPEQARVALADGRAISVAGIPARAGAETALIVLVDRTEAIRRERSEREFVANAAHELRTPLTTILGAVEVLQAGAKDVPHERDRFLAHIEREAGRLARLTRALLVLARAQSREESPPLERVELRPLLTEVAAGIHPQDGVSVEIDCAADLEVVTNRDLLEQALRNLGSNAARHTRAGWVRLRAGRAAGSVEIDVEDTGSGIAADAQRRVFERFARGERRDADGFGLGLAIVREAVQAIGGTVQLDSAAGVGTRVTIVLADATADEDVAA
jgi:signal transduction histidine kinase/HAMP domain-containing protein